MTLRIQWTANFIAAGAITDYERAYHPLATAPADADEGGSVNPSIMTMTPARAAGYAKYRPQPRLQVTRSGAMYRWRLLLSEGQLASGRCRTQGEAMAAVRAAKKLWMEENK